MEQFIHPGAIIGADTEIGMYSVIEDGRGNR